MSARDATWGWSGGLLEHWVWQPLLRPGSWFAALTSRNQPWPVGVVPAGYPPGSRVGRGWCPIRAGQGTDLGLRGGPRDRPVLTFRKGMTNGRRGKLVASWSLEWNSSMVSVEF